MKSLAVIEMTLENDRIPTLTKKICSRLYLSLRIGDILLYLQVFRSLDMSKGVFTLQ